eukprot:TRINITY_DN8575_c0_g1_i1.p1 TRINITY_DN8575_c0_g1~~TRINITY_DN8575_c0_g1_i1.p1  ORF type:complete len:193 (-),score=23.52 TRINITY_DN8575_c0_g1_i1:31-609(-)
MGCSKSKHVPDQRITVNGKQDIVDYDIFVKILTVGNHGYGKTSYIRRLCKDTFEEDTSNNGKDFETKIFNIDGERVKVQIWDTSGQERFRTITSSYYRGANCVLMFLDINGSLEDVNFWRQEIHKYSSERVLIGLIVTKSDLDSPLSYEEVFEYTEEIALPFDPVCFTSAAKGENVTESMIWFLSRYVEQRN